MYCGNPLPIYGSCRLTFLWRIKLQEILGDKNSDFDLISLLKLWLFQRKTTPLSISCIL